MIEYGVSQSLIAEFEMLRETVSINSHGSHDVNEHQEYNTYKYASKTIDKLAQYLVCRNYGKACLELAYLCWPVVRYQEHTKGLLNFFWIEENITPKKFENAVGMLTKQLGGTMSNTSNENQPSNSSTIAWQENALVISAGPTCFKINAHRVALLCAFLELLVSNIQGILIEIENKLSTSDERCVPQLASYLQKRVYAFLKLHLPVASLQNKYRYIHEWVSQKETPGKLDDQDVLSFWKFALGEEGFVKYQNTVIDMLDYQSALEQLLVQRELSFGNSLDDMSIEQSNMLLETVFASAEEEGDSFTWLMDTPKFLTKKEYYAVSMPLELHKNISQFPLSILRADVFGKWQNTMIQQTRSKTSIAMLEPELNYTAHLAMLKDWKLQSANTVLCCAAVLLKGEDPRCISLLSLAVGLVFDEAKANAFKNSLRELMPNHLPNQLHALPTFADIRRWLLQSPSLNQFFALASKALAKNNRAGFKNIQNLASNDIYSLGGEQLNHCVNIISRFRQAVLLASMQHAGNKSRSAEDIESIFQADLFIFKSEFVKRHGEINE